MMQPPTILRQLVLLAVLLVAGLAGLCAYQYFAQRAAVHATQVAQQTAVENGKLAALRKRAQAAQTTLKQCIPAHAATWSWSEQLPAMMTQVTALAKDGGARIDTLQPGPAVTREKVTRFPLRVTMRADLNAVSAVLQRVQKAEPTLAVDQLSIHPGKTAGDPLSVEVTLSSYVMADGHAATGGQP